MSWRTGAAAALAAGALGLAACSSPATGSASYGSGSQQGSGMTAASANQSLDTGSSLGGQPAPDIKLTNQFGQQMALSQFRGKVVILAFVDSECTNVCPLTTVSMLEAKQLLGAAGSKVQLIGVDANPRATSQADVMSYSRVHSMVNQWDFLTGSLPQLQAAWRAFHIAVQIQQGAIDHTPALFVIDPSGHERKLYLTQMSYASIGQSAQVLAQEAAGLLPGHPPLTSRHPLGYISGTAPATRVWLPGISTGTPAASAMSPVTLGAGKPRLVLFFATWVAETSDLRGHLLALNRYAKAARHGRLPGLVALDEGTTEPSAGAAAAYLRGLGSTLAYPVAVDTNGRLADGYGVQDQPWFALVSASGRIIWHHDGWAGLNILEAAARKA